MAELPKEHVIQVRTELGTITVRPGDKVIYATPNRVTEEQARQIVNRIGARLPDIEIIVAGECSGLAIYRDEQPDDDAIKRWILRNPEEFERWVRRQNRINGASVIGSDA